MNYLLTNIKGTGFDAENKLKKGDKHWKSKGTVYEWDQMSYVRETIAELFGVEAVDGILRTAG